MSNRIFCSWLIIYFSDANFEQIENLRDYCKLKVLSCNTKKNLEVNSI